MGSIADVLGKDTTEEMNRAPRKSDGRQGPDDGSQRALHLVVAPDVTPRRAKTFPFSASLGIGLWVLALLVFGGSLIWFRVVAALPEGVLVPMEVESVPSVDSELPIDPAEQPSARQVVALPLSPPVKIPVDLPALAPKELPKPDVVVSELPFALADNWEETAELFFVPERSDPAPEVKPKSPPERRVTPRPKVLAPVKRTPRISRQVSPVYPAAARRAGTEGTVLLAVNVQSSGRAGTVSLVNSSGSALLDAAAIRAVKKWIFHPATIAGVPTSGQVRVPVRFRLQ